MGEAEIVPSEEKQAETGICTAEESIVWSQEVEVCLFHAMLGHKPVGVNRHFHMICIRDKFSQNIGRQVSSKVIWDHLSTMYDMQALHESEILPFPNSEKSFVLPEEIIQDVKEGKVGSEDDVKEEFKEESDPPATHEEGLGPSTACQDFARYPVRSCSIRCGLWCVRDPDQCLHLHRCASVQNLLNAGMGIFQDVSAKIHQAQIVKVWFREHVESFSHMNWPPQSPDLNPIESLGCAGEDFTEWFDSILPLALFTAHIRRGIVSTYLFFLARQCIHVDRWYFKHY
ncbi:uncharacterized protein LOC127419290 isoform X1 [Myxocyprinus asiaticus]|uniref:uncharacterized protein LOC127419290 isoform X1 n=1 Tax=Myxocyprinus asiaticus TaxID=70543 RepID=UPI0022213426|nr:uncharacterized protein LOC127419290 isoform X1 [Myxocyprinus asiaticus]